MVWYNRGKHIVFDPNSAAGLGETPMDLVADRVVPGLMRAAYTIDIDAHEQYDDITTDSIVATNYIEPGNAGSNELAGKSLARNDTLDVAVFDATDLVYTSIGNGANDTIGELVITREQDATATEANTELIAHTDVPDTLTNGGNITLVWDGDGILHITA